MLLLIITLITVGAAAPNGKATDSRSFHVDDNNSVCNTPACAEAASFILENMDSCVDPCENFYQFACGKFVEKAVIPDDRIKVDFFSIIANKIQEQLLHSISDGIEEDDPPVLKLIKSYYHTCMDIGQIENNSENKLRGILENLGGCPVLDGETWNDTNFDWKRSVYQANKFGYDSNIFFSTEISVDPSNSSKRIISIDQAALQVPQDLLLDDSIADSFLSILTGTIEFFGIDGEKVKEELDESLQFEIDLLKISLSDEERRDQSKLNNRMTLDQLQTIYSFIPWTEYINEILEPYAHVDGDEEVLVAVPTFLEKLSKLIAITPKRVLANYACMRVIMQSVPSLETGTKQQPRSTKCIGNTVENLSPAVDWLYVRNYFDNNAKTPAVDLTKNVRDSLHRLVEQAKWMDEATKLAALEKLEVAAAYVGYPDELENVEILNHFYKNEVITRKSFLKSELDMKKFKKRLLYSSLRKPVNDMRWVDHSKITRASAQYNPNSNSFEVAAGILQGNFYDKDRPNYMNYGAIGSIIGHELSHAIEDQGGQSDKNGNVVDWWRNETKEEFLKKANCIVEQYGDYTIKEAEINIDGIITRGENIADNVGLKAAYLAYDEWTQKNTKEPRLPGLNYTPKQMFWISFANNYCAKYVSGVLQFLIPIEQHTVEGFRVIGSVSNMPQFSDDFKCPLGSPMNPVNKCSVW